MKFIFALGCALALALSGIARADVASGQSAYTAKGCIGCHGAGGVSTVTANPSLKGKSAQFIRQNLINFRSGARKNPIMNAMAAGLSDAEIRYIADYIDSLK